MDIAGKHVVITGGGSGIGAAMARRMAKAGGQISVADRNMDAAQAIATEVGGHAFSCDVGTESQITELVQATRAASGPIDVFVSNAGLGKGDPTHAASSPDTVWDLQWRVHVMAHVWAARALLPDMIARGSGYFVNVASAAGLLNQIGDAPYSATKHAAVSFAESLAISHAEDGIGVSALCPQYVATPLLGLDDDDAAGTLLTADDVAMAVMDGIAQDRFLILPHKDVTQYTALRAQDPDLWLAGMRKLRAVAQHKFGRISAEDFYKLI